MEQAEQIAQRGSADNKGNGQDRQHLDHPDAPHVHAEHGHEELTEKPERPGEGSIIAGPERVPPPTMFCVVIEIGRNLGPGLGAPSEAGAKYAGLGEDQGRDPEEPPLVAAVLYQLGRLHHGAPCQRSGRLVQMASMGKRARPAR